MRDPLSAISGRLVVSCQAGPGHPLRDTATIVRLARSAVAGGAAGVRCGGYGGVPDVAAVVRAVDVPVIGLTKDGDTGVYITPTVAAARAVIEAGADIIATDATGRPRPDGARLGDTIRVVHEAKRLLLADVSTVEEGVAAARLGADLVATTLAGHPTADQNSAPDIELVARLRAALPDVPIVAEGRYHTPDEVAAAMCAGATAVVVGTAITDPAWITGRFAAAITG